jgi:hypothetical protein
VTLGLLDLSIITDRVLAELDQAAHGSQLWAEEPTAPDGTPFGTPGHPIDPTQRFDITFTGLPPQEARLLDGCQVSLYLFHVSPDPAHRNTYPLGGYPQVLPMHPLGLTLYYLLSAHSKNSYIEEQQAMSIALKCLHEHAITTATVPLGDRVQEFTLTMEPHSVDEIGRLWLSLATPLSLSAVYRASVIFLEPVARTAPAGIVLEPEVTAIPTVAPTHTPPASAPTTTGTVVVTGSGFDADTIVLTIGGLTFSIVSTATLDYGQARIVDETELQLRLPKGTRRGRYFLEVRLTADAPPDRVLVDVRQDVP